MDKRKLIDVAFKELQYILTSTDKGHAINPANADHQRVINTLCTGILRGKLEGSTPLEIVRNSSYYKLAEILKAANTWEEYCKYVDEIIPIYKHNPRGPLSLGGFKWKTKFSVPPKRAMKKRKPRSVSVENEEPAVQYKSHNDLLFLHREIERLTAELGSLTDIVASHMHDTKGAAIIGVPIKVYHKRVLSGLGTSTENTTTNIVLPTTITSAKGDEHENIS